jgi:galactokinase
LDDNNGSEIAIHTRFLSMSTVDQLFQASFAASPGVITSAPGRVEIIGNHTDYNGGTVVGACIERRLHIALSLRSDSAIRLVSSTQRALVETTLEAYSSEDVADWARYPLGVFDEFRIQFGASTGFDLAVTSDIPTGEGLSSSAAIELATALALYELLGLDLPVSALVGLSHRAENRFVGVPCGLLDQSTVGFGKRNALVVLDAASGRHHNFTMPSGHNLFVFRTHIRHELQHSPYEQRHKECRNALVALNQVIPGTRHLAHLHPLDIAAYDVIMDSVVARRAQHVVDEQRRVGLFLKHLLEGDMRAAGQLLTASHKSSKELFENSTPELDFLVDGLNQFPHVLGARLSGAGWGGAVLALTTSSFTSEDANRMADAYEATFDARSHWWATQIGDGARVE